MFYDFYFRLLKLFHNKFISIMLSKLLYIFYICRFCVKRVLTRKIKTSMEREDALDILNNAHSDSCGRPTYNNCKMNPEIDLSIIIPVYNYANLIEKNIQSVLGQRTQYTYEIIIVDDGSTDGARDIVLRYSDNSKVKVILQNNQGIAGARNTGIDNATGRYLMFVDCDDIVHDDIVETLMKRAYQDDSDIVMCAHNLVKEKNGEVVDVIPNVYPSYNCLNDQNKDKIMNYAGLPWAKVYKRQLFEQVRFFPGYWYEDTIVQWLLFTQCRRFSYVPQVCYEYKWYENNFSHIQGNHTNKKSLDRYWILLAIIEQYEKQGMPFGEQFYTLLLKHLSAYYYPSLAGLEEKVVEAAFVMANELLVRYKPQEQCKLPYMLRVTEKAILTKDINLWKLASCNQ